MLKFYLHRGVMFSKFFLILGFSSIVTFSAELDHSSLLFDTDSVLFLDENNEPVKAYFSPPNNSGAPDIESRLFLTERKLEEKMRFKYYSRDAPDGITIQDKRDLEFLINISKPIKCITHGWLSGGDKDTSLRIKDGFLHRYDANVLVMDWSDISSNVLYPLPMRATTDVGKHYVGHSLGAHVSGFAGREVKYGKIGRITALDPALPGFNLGLVEYGKLNKSDALFVDVIHTCAGVLGYWDPLGHVDIYPNGGVPPQPGCNVIQFYKACSHGMSWKIFASSLMRTKPYIASECSTVHDVAKKNCKERRIAYGDSTPKNVSGIFYGEVHKHELIFHDIYDKD
ncbi:lipase member H-like isoform X2 [Sitophilus oryzae]|uniref:Lipase member H-like isoform X2 n=1 Tax=Sitophilus oryzae TaxID=7048 RepID=A0A6J2XVE6_SITOR|nr:lipase member H-like isoform X2 [Sitophilus oryzae]